MNYASRLDSVIKLIGLAEFDESGKLYASVAPMLIEKDRPLAGVDGVFNAITVMGDSVGELMFYGRGAGKLPTASAVVADMVDCVRHPDRSKQLKWEEASGSLVKDIAERKVSCFVRTTESLSRIREIFEVKTVVEGVVDGEIGFITDVMKESEVGEAMAKLGNVVSFLRILA